MELSWYIKLNILVISFLFVVFLIKKTNTTQFKQGLQSIFSGGQASKEIRPAVKILNP